MTTHNHDEGSEMTDGTLSIDELIAKQRQADAPPLPELTPLQALLEQHRDRIAGNWQDLEVTLAGQIVDVTIGQITGVAWVKIQDRHPAAAPADINLGWNRDTLPRDYPTDRIKLRGDHPATETWQAVYDLLTPEDRRSVAAVVWWLNWGEPEQQLAAATRGHE